MADKEIKVKSTAKKVENEKTEKQKEELAAGKKRKEEADKKAEEASKKAAEEKAAKEAAAKKAKEEKEKKEKEEAEQSSLKAEDVIAAGTALAGAALSVKKSRSGFLKGLIVGAILGALVTGVIGYSMMGSITDKVETTKETADAIIDETFTGYTALDFKNAVLGEASEHQELIVMEQDLQILTTVTKAGLGNLEIFSKTKDINYAGTGVYTVDLSGIDEDHIEVDEENKTVTVYIPHTVLQYVNIDYDNIEFNDTEKGLLAFGDLALTAEQQTEIEKSVQEAMRAELESESLFAQADELAKYKTWDIFQPLISAVSAEYKVDIEFSK